ncbi:MAG TPA: cupin domain-containing protein, partial [Negativicutes bacterium]
AGSISADSKEALLEGDIPAIVRKVLAQVMKPACPNPRVIQVRGGSVVLERFDQAPPGQKVMMKDVVTAREGNLCAGFMSYDHSELPWRLTYDEVDYVVQGVFTVQVGDQTYTCQEGDIMYIPKNTAVVFGSPSQTKVFYVTYPANWAELS